MAMIRMLMEELRKAEDEREEARRVADMERDEARKQEEVRRENLRVEREEARRAEENRRETLRVEREEARRAEDLVREQALKVQLVAKAVENARRQAVLQTEQNAKYLEQQIALMRVQAEIGQEAARLYREEIGASKMRDRAVASIPNFKEGEDVQDFKITAERKLTAGSVRRDEWITIVASKLSEKLGST